jgi:hypothetical protein
MAHCLLLIDAARPTPLADPIRRADRASLYGGISSVPFDLLDPLDLLFHRES